ncbi:MAG: hypothetical protein IKQ99_03065 [Alphaproteobacteria bacterium]|nr:hypothetical protein [Alphaproteobacteria bacterium]
MLRDFRRKLQKLSLGKRKFILDQLNVCFLRDREENRQQFIYAASLLIDEKKTLKEAVFLVKNCFAVTSKQYENYSLVLEAYKNSLTDIGRKRFCSNIMKKNASQKTLAISAEMRQNKRH